MKKRLFGLVAIPLIAIGSLTYANDYIVPDTENGTITVYSQDYSYGITIQDKNLGAENVGDYGYYYQWGNNHGNYAGTNTGGLNELLDADVSERVNKGYSGGNDNFIIFNNGNKITYDYRSGVYYTNATDNSYVGDSAYNNLRGGGNDNDDSDATIVKGYDTENHVVTNPENRQGPCPEGYHVPSAGEWHELMMLRCNANSDICSGSIINSQDRDEEYEWAYYLDDGGEGIIGTAFMNDLLLPFAGSRNYYDGAVYAQGNYANYRSSSPRGGSNPGSAWYLRFYTSNVSPSNSRRAYGQPLRCFKNSYVKLPKTLNLFFMSDDEEVGTGTITENMTGSIPASAESVSRTGYELLYWSLSGADTEFDFATTPISGDWADESGNVYFIAQWTDIKYEIKFDAGGGTGTMENQMFTYDVAQNLRANAFTRNSYTFSGWTDGTNIYTNRQSVKNLTTTSGNIITLTAQRTKDKQTGGYSGGGGMKKDNCPNGDLSPSYYDGACEGDNTQDSSDKPSEGQYSDEFQQAYEFAYKNGITTMDTIDKANMNGKLTRIAMAKMLSYYAINVLGQKPDETRINKFNDITEKLDADYDNGVTLAYQLGIMGINMPDNKFRPNDEVTRAEFATALSRMIYHTSDGEYESTPKYYIHHMEKLVKEGIITKDDPNMKELRGYVMIMLKRSAK